MVFGWLNVVITITFRRAFWSIPISFYSRNTKILKITCFCSKMKIKWNFYKILTWMHKKKLINNINANDFIFKDLILNKRAFLYYMRLLEKREFYVCFESVSIQLPPIIPLSRCYCVDSIFTRAYRDTCIYCHSVKFNVRIIQLVFLVN